MGVYLNFPVDPTIFVLSLLPVDRIVTYGNYGRPRSTTVWSTRILLVTFFFRERHRRTLCYLDGRWENVEMSSSFGNKYRITNITRSLKFPPELPRE